MKNSKTIYLETINKIIIVIFLCLVFVFASMGYNNLNRDFLWLAVSQFVIAGGILFYLIWHDVMTRYMGPKYLHFDETGVEYKVRYMGETIFFHWQDISKIIFHGVRILLVTSEYKQNVTIKLPIDKCDDIRHEFERFSDSHNIEIEIKKK